MVARFLHKLARTTGKVLLQPTRGQALVEYALGVALIAILGGSALTLTGSSARDAYGAVVCTLNGQGQEECGCELNEAVTRAPRYACVADMLAVEALTSCGTQTELSLQVNAPSGTRDIGLSYDPGSNAFVTTTADPGLCSSLAENPAQAQLISRHTNSDTINTFPFQMSLSPVAGGSPGGGSIIPVSGGGSNPLATEEPIAEVTQDPFAECPVLTEQALQQLSANCGTMGRNTACYGHNYVFASFSEAVPDTYFSVPSDRAELLNVRELNTSAMNPLNDQWGLSLMSVQADLPNTIPGQSVIMLLVGDAQATNTVAPDAARDDTTVQVRTTQQTTLRSSPSYNANVVARVNSGLLMDADFQSSGGEWVRVAHNNVASWLSRSAASGADIGTLPVYGSSSYSPMQAFRLTTNPLTGVTCGQVPNVMMVQTPHHTQVALNVNSTTITIGSTVVMSIDPSTDDLMVYVLDGTATVAGVPLTTCQAARISGGSWVDIHELTASEREQMETLERIPSNLLHYAINVCTDTAPPAPITTAPPTTGAVWAGSTTCNRTIDWSGSNNTIVGDVHTNRDLYVSGSSNKIFGNTSFVLPLDIGGILAFLLSPLDFLLNPAQQVASQPDPLNVDITRFAPGGDIALAAQARGEYVAVNGDISIGWLESNGYYDSNTGELRDGIYYSTSNSSTSIDLSDSDIIGIGGGPARVTFISLSGVIKINGQRSLLAPYVGPGGVVAQGLPGLLAFTNRQEAVASNRCTNGVVQVSGSDQQWQGVVYAPRGQIAVSGSSSAGAPVRGSLISLAVKLNGSNWRIEVDLTLIP